MRELYFQINNLKKLSFTLSVRKDEVTLTINFSYCIVKTKQFNDLNALSRASFVFHHGWFNMQKSRQVIEQSLDVQHIVQDVSGPTPEI